MLSFFILNLKESHKRQKEVESLRHNQVIAGGQASLLSPELFRASDVQVAVPLHNVAVRTPVASTEQAPTLTPNFANAWKIFQNENSWQDIKDQEYYMNEAGLVNESILAFLDVNEVTEIEQYLKRFAAKAWISSFGYNRDGQREVQSL